MSSYEIDTTKFGDMIDYMNCDAIYNGAKPKQKQKFSTMEDIVFGDMF